MSTPYRGLLIGCGFFANNHLNAWRDVEGAEIVAVCDRDRAKTEATAQRFGIPKVYGDAREALEGEKPDFVDIVTTSPSHRPLVELAAPFTKLVICQKPMAESMADGEAMIQAAEKAGIPFLIHENFRWQRPFRDIAQRLKAGEVGKIQFARFSFRHGYDNYKNQPYLAEIERFTLMDVGLHLFDLARSLVGEAKTLSCLNQRLNPRVRGEDAFTALVGHESGATSVIDCSFYSVLDPQPFPQTLAVIEGEQGTLELLEGFRLNLHTHAGKTSFDLEPPVPAWGEKPWHIIQDSVLAFNRHVIEVLDGRATPQPSGADNLKTLRMALSAYDADAEGKVITLADWRESAS